MLLFLATIRLSVEAYRQALASKKTTLHELKCQWIILFDLLLPFRTRWALMDCEVKFLSFLLLL